MRNSHFLILASIGLVSVFTACSTDEDDPVAAGSDNVIRFTAASRLPQNRATADITTSNLTQFFVYGYLNSDGSPYMTNVEVNKTGTNVWEYSPVKYWPTGDALNFYAYAPEGNAASRNHTAGRCPLHQQRKNRLHLRRVAR